jgi:hypothetical protein
MGRGVRREPVLLPRPEKASEAVLLLAGNDVDVQMRNALAYLVVDGDERAVRSEGGFDRTGQSLRAGEEGRDQLGGQIRQRFVVGARNEEDVAHEEGPGIEESKARFILEYAVGRPRGRHDLAEDAGHARV